MTYYNVIVLPIDEKVSDSDKTFEGYTGATAGGYGSTDLREKLKSMTPKQKEANRDHINSLIGSLREKNKQERAYLQEQFKSSSSSLREGHKQEKTNLKEEYDQKYVDELDKIRSTKSFQKVSKRKKS